MGKVKSFAAKLAHDVSSEGKVICPVCNAEVRRVKIIQNIKTDGTWRPDKKFVKLCKCNEQDLMSGKNI
jgi:ribosomal protein S3AE